ncbi:unnamed protein product [Staurois parvus]|uniref:Uncharacterized protein n=1 Tax=Staurois parvus TaxID=386267 RepID=A0ABN9DAZ9_9NEOB|nr:unnamed protein product [Staurois parvus]
MPRDCPSF